MVTGEPKKSPIFSQRSPGGGGSNNGENLFSPRFKSVAAMAGWDEETLLIASLIVDDTPDRECKNKKRMNITFKTPPSNSRRKRRDQQRANSTSIPVTVLNLDEEESPVKETKKETGTSNGKGRTEAGGSEMPVRGSSGSAPVASIPCMDKLREELSCAICLEICFEPSTTPCGHSFCKKCLRSAADKCGKRCPKCRQLMGNGRSCTVNTVLWNTIQLLFPNEIEARKACSTSSEIQDTKSQTRDRDRDISSHRRQQNVQTRAAQIVEARRSARNNDDSSGDIISINHHRRQQEVAQTRTRRAVETRNNEEDDDDDLSFRRRRRALPAPSQDEDAALALRLQREEFMEVVRGRGSSHDNSRISIALARENLRAMASRAISVRLRHRAT